MRNEKHIFNHSSKFFLGTSELSAVVYKLNFKILITDQFD